jgi:hypothetical protein
MKKTVRGFDILNFKDRNGVQCSLQKSSIATEDCIWLGCDVADPRACVPGKGWQKVEVPEGTIFNDRMHLTQKMAAALIPVLQKFVDTGELE